MALGFLRGSGSDELSIQLDRSDARYGPGDVILATVTLAPGASNNVREVRAGLMQWERFQEVEQYRQDGRTRTRESWRTDESWVDGQQLQGDGAHQLQLRIPMDPAPAGKGDITELRWLVKATLDRQMARDSNKEIELNLVVPADRSWNQPGLYGTSSSPNSAMMQFELPGLELVAGETFRGKVVINAVEDCNARGVRLELLREERVTAGVRANEQSRIVHSMQIASGTKIPRGQHAVVDFALPVPTGLCPGRRTRHSEVRYKIKAVFDRAWASDFQVEQEVALYNASA